MTIVRNLALGLAFGLVAGAASAQSRSTDDTVVVTRVEPAPQDEGLARRNGLARELIGLSVGPNFAKEFERGIGEQMGKIDGKEGEEAAWLRANMPSMMSRMIVRLMDDMAPAYASVYSEEELSAQIAFYRSPVGRSVAGKTIALGLALQDVQLAVVQAYLTEFESKYCARFDCGEAAQTSAKSRR